jgi:hypothetical protein
MISTHFWKIENITFIFLENGKKTQFVVSLVKETTFRSKELFTAYPYLFIHRVGGGRGAEVGGLGNFR